MATLDTNVLVRYLIADDKRQFELARAFVESTIRKESLFLPVSVTVELEWVLRSRY
ncbi:MAG: PIN domain-containing protein, partial [Burkholderiaceae bacterium]